MITNLHLLALTSLTSAVANAEPGTLGALLLEKPHITIEK